MQFALFRSHITRLLASEHVQFDEEAIQDYGKNVCALDRKILGVIYPENVTELEQIIAVSRATGIPLYPLSRGYNLGLGSRLPVQDNHVIVDLRRMNRILSFDNDLGTIQIEPGVTQQEVASYLLANNANFILNVTGSAADSSIAGNALERGVAHYGSRAAEIISLSVVLGNGGRIDTGFSPHSHIHAAHSYPHGIGPDYRGLFFQSNFGIITSVTLRLLPKTASVTFISLHKTDVVSLEKFIDELREAKHKGLLPENLHISNRPRRLAGLTPLLARRQNISLKQASEIAEKHITGEWAASASLRGERAILDATVQCLNKQLKKTARITVLHEADFNPEKDSMHATLKGTIGHALGQPSSDALLSLGYELNQLIDKPLVDTDIGTLFIIPVLPFRGYHFAETTNCITNTFRQHGFDAYMTFNLVDHINLEGVINLIFTKSDPSAVQAAHSCVQNTFNKLEKAGYPPMRLGITQRSTLQSSNMELRKQLKTYFDPDNILARGRYE